MITIILCVINCIITSLKQGCKENIVSKRPTTKNSKTCDICQPAPGQSVGFAHSLY